MLSRENLGWQPLSTYPPEAAVAAFTPLTPLEREIQQLSLQLLLHPTPQAVQPWTALLILGAEKFISVSLG